MSHRRLRWYAKADWIPNGALGLWLWSRSAQSRALLWGMFR